MRNLGPFGALLLAIAVPVACGGDGATGFGSLGAPGAGPSSSGSPGGGGDVDGGSGNGGNGGGGASSGGASSGGTSSGGTSSGGTSSGGSSSGGGGGDAGASVPPAPPPGAGIPCDVGAVLAAKCDSCHSDPPVNGSLSGLVTLADLMATSQEDPTKNEAELALARMQSSSAPMPPATTANPVTAAEIQSFQQWINGNYQGSCADASAPAPPTDVFSGAPPYTATLGSSSHNAGKDCMGGCHNHGFTFAGTLTNGAGAGVASAEVRLVDAKGTAITVHTGSNGNFHSSTPFVGPAHIGARDATNKALMVTALQPANGGCNGCHATGGTVAPIHLP